MLYSLAEKHPELEAVSQNLSITTLRYIPKGCSKNSEKKDDYLNNLNEEILNALQTGGEAFLSNAIVNEMYCLRACIVNFRTSQKDIMEIVDIIIREGRKTHSELQEPKVNK